MKDRKSDDSLERELLFSYLRRDESALKITKERYGALIQSVLKGVLRDERDVEECCNEVLLKLWNSIPPTVPVSFTAYLCRTARNCALDRQKALHRGKRKGQEFPVDELTDLFDQNEMPEEKLLSGELTAILNDFLASLPEKQRRIALLRWWFGLSAREVAGKCGVSVRTVQLGLSDVKEKLQKRLRKEGYFQ